jgi:hypothetical protein
MKPSLSSYEKNELEMALEVAIKHLSEMKGGIIFNKGLDFESKISYHRAAKVLRAVRDRFGMDGCFSFSICKTCKSWYQPPDNAPYRSNDFGGCRANSGKSRWCYETCERHTQNKETWGL